MHQWRKRYCIVRVNRGQEYQIAFFRSVDDADLAMAGKKISTSRVYVLPAGTVVEMQSTVLPSGVVEEEEVEEKEEEENHDKRTSTTWYGLSLKLATQEMFLFSRLKVSRKNGSKQSRKPHQMQSRMLSQQSLHQRR